jgi:hypothetical protein
LIFGHLPFVNLSCIDPKERQVKMVDQITQNNQDVLDIANKIASFIIINPTILPRFRKHIDRFCKMVEKHGQALQPYARRLKKAEERWKQDTTSGGLSLVDYCSPPKGWVEMFPYENPFINVDIIVNHRPAEPVNPLFWLGTFGNASSQRKPTPEEKLMCEYVRMAIIHDYKLRYSGTPTDTPIFSADYKGKWFQRDEFCKDVWKYYLYYQNPDRLHNTATNNEKLTQLELSFERIRTDLAQTPSETEKGNVNVNIFGGVQAGNLQIAQDASIHEQSVTEEKKKGIVRKVLKIVGAIIVGIIASLLADILCGFGWFGRIKHLFTR